MWICHETKKKKRTAMWNVWKWHFCVTQSNEWWKKSCNKEMAFSIQLGNKNPSSFSLLYCKFVRKFYFPLISFLTSHVHHVHVLVYENIFFFMSYEWKLWQLSYIISFVVYHSYVLEFICGTVEISGKLYYCSGFNQAWLH